MTNKKRSTRKNTNLRSSAGPANKPKAKPMTSRSSSVRAASKQESKTMARRVGLESSATRIVILDATEQLMLEEGYAAVSTRRVASKAGLKPPLVHYYFPKTDDLLLAVYRRSAERNQERLAKALASEMPLQALWTLNTDAMRTGLAVEFMGMATHRKLIRDEIAHYVQLSRSAQAEALARLFNNNQNIGPSACTPSGMSMLIAGISRSLIMEEALGISSGHAEAVAFVEWWLQRLDAGRASAAPDSPT